MARLWHQDDHEPDRGERLRGFGEAPGRPRLGLSSRCEFGEHDGLGGRWVPRPMRGAASSRFSSHRLPATPSADPYVRSGPAQLRAAISIIRHPVRRRQSRTPSALILGSYGARFAQLAGDPPARRKIEMVRT